MDASEGEAVLGNDEVRRVAQRIQSIRKNKGWSQQTLAAKIGLKTYHPIVKYESGEMLDMPISTVAKIAKAFEVPCWLFFIPDESVPAITATKEHLALISGGNEIDLRSQRSKEKKEFKHVLAEASPLVVVKFPRPHRKPQSSTPSTPKLSPKALAQ